MILPIVSQLTVEAVQISLLSCPRPIPIGSQCPVVRTTRIPAISDACE
jgi:hypothetical protein